MAKVVDYYSATAGGSSTMYYYRYADNTSAATRIYTGTVIHLAADYGSRITNGMYLMRSPSGWIHWYHVQNIEPVYKTITDACTAPTALALDPSARVLAITGGAGGDLNEWTGFGVSWRERRINDSVWSEWSEDETVAGRSVTVTVNSGMVRQFRVRTLGAAGSAYYSDYVVCDTLLNGNTAAGTPVVLLPLSGLATCAAAVMVKIECPAEPDGDAMTLQRSLDGSAWATAANVSASGGLAYDLFSVFEGTHTLKYRLVDANGEAGGEDSITFSCVPCTWTRAIAAGDVIASREISFASDIREMLERVNLQRAFHGLSDLSLPGTVGRVGDWHSQLSAMQQAVNECRAAVGRAAWGFDEPSGWPSAQQINQLRTAIENT